jgi:glucose-6-phosphate isomerase
MIDIKFENKNAKKYFSDNITKYEGVLSTIHSQILQHNCKGSDFLGWLDLPNTIESVVPQILKEAKRVNSNYDYLVVVGIGGSYLGSKAVLEALTSQYSSHSKTKIIFAGHQLSGTYHSQLLSFLEDKNYCINVISKSGTTIEPALAFRLLKSQLISRFGEEETKERIIAITDSAKGVLYEEAVKKGYTRFIVPNDVGGRFSVLSSVGLFPLAVSGIDIASLLAGAREASLSLLHDSELKSNIAMQYAVSRFLLYSNNYKVELSSSFNPSLSYLFEWWKQLFGESEGKEHKGLFVASSIFSTDLHSLGQYIQDGSRVFFETIVSVTSEIEDVVIPFVEGDSDKLNYLAGKKYSYVNEQAQNGTIDAHIDGSVPLLNITINKLDEFNLGQLIYFYELSCAYSAYLLDVNPFNQEGVEAYKKNMFRLLGKK